METPSLALDPESTLTFSHHFYYSNRSPIPAGEIAEALMALERIVSHTPRVMRAIVPRASMPHAQLFVEKLESGSLSEDVIVKLCFGSKKEMDRTLRLWKKRLGIDLKAPTAAMRTIIIALLLAGGIYAAWYVLSPADRATIEISHNTIISVGAQELQMTPEELRKIIDTVVVNRKQLADDAVKVVKPAKRDPKATISVDGSSSNPVVISHEVIATVPDEVTKDERETSTIHPHANVDLRALDLDSSEKGWAAIVTEIAPNRVRLELGAGVKPDALFGKKVILGTVESISRKNSKGEDEIRLYRLISIDPAPTSPSSPSAG